MKDRKELRKVDELLAHQGRYLTLITAILYVLVAYKGGFFNAYPSLCINLGGLLLVLSGFNALLTLRFDQLYGAGPARWRSLFLLLQLAMACFVGSFSAVIILLEGLVFNAYLMLLFSGALIALSMSSWAPYAVVAYAQLTALCLPVVVSLMLLTDPNAILLAAFVSAFWVAALVQIRRLHQTHWQHLTSISDLQSQTHELTESINQTREEGPFKNHLVASMSNEMRAPIANVLGLLSLMKDNELNDQQRELHQVALKSSESLLRLTEDILDFSKISAGQISLTNQVFNLPRCIEQATEVLGPRAHGRGFELICRCDPELPQRVQGDEFRIVQMINNLITHAIKFSKGNEILIRADSDGYSLRAMKVKLSVRDNGSGMDEETQHQTQRALSALGELGSGVELGAGLGLAICKGLASLMGGEIGFVSQPGIGTEFWCTIELPVSTQQAQKRQPKVIVEQAKGMLIGTSSDLDQSFKTQLEASGSTLVKSDYEALLTRLELTEIELTGSEDCSQSLSEVDFLIVNLRVGESLTTDFHSQLLAALATVAKPVILLATLAQKSEANAVPGCQADAWYWLTKPVTSTKIQAALIAVLSQQKIIQRQVIVPPQVTGSSLMQAKANPVTSSQRCRVLLVEDNEVTQLVIKTMLRKLQHQVDVVGDGHLALDRLANNSYDLVFMDCDLPGLTGYEVAQQWRQNEVKLKSHIPIVALTASTLEDAQQRCLATGMDDFLPKPVNLEELDAKLRYWLGDNAGSVSKAQVSA